MKWRPTRSTITTSRSSEGAIGRGNASSTAERGARVPNGLLNVLAGSEGDWERLVIWRSKWFDLFLVRERIEAMELVWGMMAWLMRKVEGDEDGKEEKTEISG